jgi:hypothetical protein
MPGRVQGLAKSDRHPGKALQFQGNVLDDVTRPRASFQPLNEPAGFANRALVTVKRWDQIDQPVRETGKGVGGLIFEFANIQEHEDGWISAVTIRPPEGSVFENFHAGASAHCLDKPSRGGYFQRLPSSSHCIAAMAESSERISWASKPNRHVERLFVFSRMYLDVAF